MGIAFLIYKMNSLKTDIITTSSLLKYENPVILSNKEGLNIKKRLNDQNKSNSIENDDDEFNGSHVDQKSTSKIILDENMITSDILDYLLPPKQWSEKEKIWFQKVSSVPSTRQDVIKLETELDKNLTDKKAKLAGICQVRREIFAECFNEIIRQVTINCAERGQLLLRIRDELFCTLNTLETLYESSLAFGLRKALNAEQTSVELKTSTKDLNTKNKEMEDRIAEMQVKIDRLEKSDAEQRQIEEKKHSDEVKFLKRNNQQLKAQIESIISAKK